MKVEHRLNGKIVTPENNKEADFELSKEIDEYLKNNPCDESCDEKSGEVKEIYISEEPIDFSKGDIEGQIEKQAKKRKAFVFKKTETPCIHRIKND